MATTFLSTSIISTTSTAYSISTGDPLTTIIDEGVLIYGFSNGIFNALSDTVTLVNGTLGSETTTGFSNFRDDSRTIVSATGSIYSLSDSNSQQGLTMGPGGQLINDGMIFGARGIALGSAAGTDSKEDIHITNTGTIRSLSDGTAKLSFSNAAIDARRGFDNDELLIIDNSGLIEGTRAQPGRTYAELGSDAVAIAATISSTVSDPQLRLTNSGTIKGGIYAGYLVDEIDNSGEMHGTITMRRGDDLFRNTGDVFGDVYLGEDEDTVLNLGLVVGSVNLGSGDDLYVGGLDGTVTGGVFGDDGQDTLRGSEAGDELYGEDDDDVLHGRGGDDELYGGDNDDLLRGGAGDDTLYGDNSSDTLYGGDGNDEIFGGISHDVIKGGSGDDDLWGEDGNDDIQGRSGDDFLSGGSGFDDLFGGSGNDTLEGGIENDTLDGGADNDDLFGDTGEDVLYGSSGADTLSGGDDADTLHGGSGDDLIDGGAGQDLMVGGTGADTFVFLSTTEMGNSSSTRDTILDFSVSEDVVDVMAFGSLTFSASGAIGGGTASIFFGSADSGASAAVRIDSDGDGSRDAQVILTGVDDTMLTEANIVFMA